MDTPPEVRSQPMEWVKRITTLTAEEFMPERGPDCDAERRVLW